MKNWFKLGIVFVKYLNNFLLWVILDISLGQMVFKNEISN